MDNTYNIDFIARCIAGHNKTDIKSIITELENVQKQVGGVSLVEITQEDYDALTDKDPSTIYLVSNGDKITLYIGGTEVNVQSDWTQTITTADDYIKNKPTLGTAAARNATDTYNATGTDVTTGKAVAAALATLPEPMVFKGSLGTGGTITTLPTASSSNKGYVYKVITAGIYANLSAKVGDTFISDGSTWVLIPSGDEPSGTVTNVAVANGGGLTVSGSPITSSGTITVGHSNSVTAKTSSSVKKFTYDANGHVTGSSELSTAESNVLASGIDSTKVEQIETNKSNISLLDTNTTLLKNTITTIRFASGVSRSWEFTQRTNYHIFVVFGFVQGVGLVYWTCKIDNTGTLKVYDTLTNTEVTQSTITYSVSDSVGTVTIQSSVAQWSYLTIIKNAEIT